MRGSRVVRHGRADIASVRRTVSVPILRRFLLFIFLTLGVSQGSALAVGVCPNEARRVEQGSTRLPDCRAYEQVTPVEKSGTQDISFEVSDQALVADEGERVALKTTAPLGSKPSNEGTRAVFVRGASGWEMTSYKPVGSGEATFEPNIFSPDLSQVAGTSFIENRHENNDSPDETFEAGTPGGPYEGVATVPFDRESGSRDEFAGGSENFEHVVLASTDTNLPVTEGASEPIDESADDLYDVYDRGAAKRLINVTNTGSTMSPCGASLGGGSNIQAPDTGGAISSDGSKIFFTVPDVITADNPETNTEAGCKSPLRLFMRVDGRETVEVSAPEAGVTPTAAEEELPVTYQGASADGSKVFFTTKIELTANDTTHENELYEYDTITKSLTRISRGESGSTAGEVELGGYGVIAASEEGDIVYFEAEGRLTANAPVTTGVADDIYRYDTGNETIQYVATSIGRPNGVGEIMHTTADGRFLLFVSHGVVGESRGQGHNEIYRYDAEAGGTPVCVSCGPAGIAVTGNATLPTALGGVLISTPDATPQFTPILSNGNYVFFNTAVRLVPEDTNSTAEAEDAPLPGQDVYEWEEDGVGGCGESGGCTHLISSGTSENYTTLLGASENGENVFFGTAARLVPQDQDDLGDIYDARVDGGFPAPPGPVQCSGEACKLIPSAPPVVSTPLSATFVGLGNVPPPAGGQQPGGPAGKPSSVGKLTSALRACRKKGKRRRARCEKQARQRYGASAAKGRRGHASGKNEKRGRR